MDYGAQALLEQLVLLQACGIVAIGCGANLAAAAEAKYVQVDDFIIATIGFTAGRDAGY